MLRLAGIAAVWLALVFEYQANGAAGTPTRYALFAAIILISLSLIRSHREAKNEAQEFSHKGTEK